MAEPEALEPSGAQSAAVEGWLEALARPGAAWSGPERVAAAMVARAALADTGPPTGLPAALPSAAAEAVQVVAAAPATVDAGAVDRWSGALGDDGVTRYVELVGIAAGVAAIDTFARGLGVDPVPFPEPADGPPTGERPDPPPRPGRAWVPMGNPALPPFVLYASPPAVRAQNLLSDGLYLTLERMVEPGLRHGGLHRAQIELVAAVTSHVNECFY